MFLVFCGNQLHRFAVTTHLCGRVELSKNSMGISADLFNDRTITVSLFVKVSFFSKRLLSYLFT